MNTYQNTQSGAGLLKSVYPGKGLTSQMNDQHPTIHAIRRRRDAVKK